MILHCLATCINTKIQLWSFILFTHLQFGTRDQIADIHWLCGSPKTGKFWKRWEYQTTWPASWEIYMQVKKQQLELDMEQWTGSKLRREYVKVTSILSPCLFNLYAEDIMRNARLDEAQAGIKIAGRNIKTSDMQICRWHHPYSRKWRRTKEPLDESERGEWKSWLKSQHSEN